jgi:signal peptidase I
MAFLTSTASQEVRSKKSLFREYAWSICVALLLALFIRTFVVQSFLIPSGSMEHALAIGDRIFVNKFIFGTHVPLVGYDLFKFRDPRQGDVIVFEYPRDPSKDFIKRVVGTPGDVVEIRNKRVLVNHVPYIDGQEVHGDPAVLPAASSPRDNFGPIVVPRDAYFVLGDSRDNSYDSRFWGFVLGNEIKGLAMIKFWSWDGDHFRVRWENIGRLISWSLADWEHLRSGTS